MEKLEISACSYVYDVVMSGGLNTDWQELSQNNPKKDSLDALQVPRA